MSKMCFRDLVVLVLLVTSLATCGMGQKTTKVESKFRILAPQFICPKDENSVVEKPDNTVITLQTAEADIRIEWTVRWSLLTPAPAQRVTLLLWRTVRALERQLNRPPAEPLVYVIDNSELLPGVNYIFNVSSVESNGEVSEPKSFHIDNTQGDQKLMIEGRNDMLSVILIGAEVANADAIFVVEADITTCQPTQDYYFVWTIQSLGSHDSVDVTQVQGSRLEVPSCTLKAGFIYNVNCQIMRYNTGDLITQTGMPFFVQYRGLEVYLNVDQLLIPSETPFTVESIVISHDHCATAYITYEWECTHKGESCNSRITLDNELIYFSSGLDNVGEYNITVTVRVSNETATANAIITVVDTNLPVIQVTPISRVLNKGDVACVIANATNLPPSCTLTWYFATKEYLASLNLVTNDTCNDCQHGEALSETVTIHSLEEQFLTELVDFSNETEWRQVTASFPASEGRARFVVQCGCSLVFNCQTQGVVYADLWFQINKKPRLKDVMVSPETGTALETVFRLSTRQADDLNTPLQYSFHCTVGNDTILLGSYFEHRAVETFLPYVEGGVEVFVKVCDALGACARSKSQIVTLAPGEARTADALIIDARAHVRRCELAKLMKVVQSAVITYTNTRSSAVLTKFYETLNTSLSKIDNENCVMKHYNEYSAILSWLAKQGVESGVLSNGDL